MTRPLYPVHTMNVVVPYPVPVAMDTSSALPPIETAIEVQFAKGFWWQIPRHLASSIMSAFQNGCAEVVFTYDWGYQRPNNYRPRSKSDDTEQVHA